MVLKVFKHSVGPSEAQPSEFPNLVLVLAVGHVPHFHGQAGLASSARLATSCSFNCAPCECPGDLDGDLAVGVSDILAALSEFGCMVDCTADMNDDGQVTVSDFLEILSVYGEMC